LRCVVVAFAVIVIALAVELNRITRLALACRACPEMSRPDKKERDTKKNRGRVTSVERAIASAKSQIHVGAEGITVEPHNTSFSSVEIESLVEEPQRVGKRDKERQQSSERSRARSHSLSRTLVRSFRRKKKINRIEGATATETESSRPEKAERIAPAKQSSADGDDEEQFKITRILRMGSLRRRNKSVPPLPEGGLGRSISVANFNFFKRDRKDKDKANCTPDPADTDVNECEKELATRRSKLRASMMRRFKTNKSTEEVEASTSDHAENRPNRWRARRSMSMFGSSFSLKKMFHNETVPEEGFDNSTGAEPKLGIMKRSESSRQKLSQLIGLSSKAETDKSEACNDSRWEKIKQSRSLFNRNSFVLKKRSTAKSTSLEEPAAETSPTKEADVSVEQEDQSESDELHSSSNASPSDEEEVHEVTEYQKTELAETTIQQNTTVTNQPEAEDNQEDHIEEKNETEEVNAEEANVVVSQAREDRQAENAHGLILEADKSNLEIHSTDTEDVDCPDQENLEKVSSTHSSS